MKKILFTILLLSIFLVNASAQGVKFEDSNLEAALKKASRKNTPNLLFVDCYTTWCGPCRTMTNTVFPQKICGDFFNKNFINIKIDMEKGEGPEIKEKYGVKVYPTFLILTPDGKELNRIAGGYDAETFIEKIKVAMDMSNSPAYLEKTYTANPNTENCIKLLKSYLFAYMHDEIAVFLKENFKNLSEETKFHKDMFDILARRMGEFSDITSDVFMFYLENRLKSDSAFGFHKFNNMVSKAYSRGLCVWLGGRAYQDIPRKELVHIVHEYLLLNPNSDAAKKISELVQYTLAGDLDKIANVFKWSELRSFSSSDLSYMEILTSNSKFTDKQKKIFEKYFLDKAAELKRTANNAEGTAKRYFPKEVKKEN